MTDSEVAMLRAVAGRDGLSVSDWIRLAVRNAHRKVFGDDAQSVKRRK